MESYCKFSKITPQRCFSAKPIGDKISQSFVTKCDKYVPFHGIIFGDCLCTKCRLNIFSEIDSIKKSLKFAKIRSAFKLKRKPSNAMPAEVATDKANKPELKVENTEYKEMSTEFATDQANKPELKVENTEYKEMSTKIVFKKVECNQTNLYPQLSECETEDKISIEVKPEPNAMPTEVATNKANKYELKVENTEYNKMLTENVIKKEECGQTNQNVSTADEVKDFVEQLFEIQKLLSRGAVQLLDFLREKDNTENITRRLQPLVPTLKFSLAELRNILPDFELVELLDNFFVKKEVWRRATQQKTIKQAALCLVSCKTLFPESELLLSTVGKRSKGEPINESKLKAVFTVICSDRMPKICRQKEDFISHPDFPSEREQIMIKRAIANYINKTKQTVNNVNNMNI